MKSMYTNEIPLLNNLMNSPLYSKLTSSNYNNNFTSFNSLVIQYVDDSTNLISSRNLNELNSYINKYFNILEKFYELNKLTLNSDKTKFMFICKPNLRNNTNDIQLETTDYSIEQSTKVKILGMYISAGLCNNANINSIISKVNYRLNILRKVLKYTNYRTSKMLVNSIIISVFKYGCPLLINSNTQSLNKINSLLLKCTRPILGFQSYI